MNLRQWIVKQSALYKERAAFEDFSSEIKTCGLGDGVHVYEGIEKMAEEVGADLYVNDYGYKAFSYNGVEFFQI